MTWGRKNGEKFAFSFSPGGLQVQGFTFIAYYTYVATASDKIKFRSDTQEREHIFAQTFPPFAFFFPLGPDHCFHSIRFSLKRKTCLSLSFASFSTMKRVNKMAMSNLTFQGSHFERKGPMNKFKPVDLWINFEVQSCYSSNHREWEWVPITIFFSGPTGENQVTRFKLNFRAIKVTGQML